MAAAAELTAQTAAAIGVRDREQLRIIVRISSSNVQILKLLGASPQISAPQMVARHKLSRSNASPATAGILRLNLQVKPTKSIFRHDLVVNPCPLYNETMQYTHKHARRTNAHAHLHAKLRCPTLLYKSTKLIISNRVPLEVDHHEAFSLITEGFANGAASQVLALSGGVTDTRLQRRFGQS